MTAQRIPSPKRGTQIIRITRKGRPIVLKEVSNRPGQFIVMDADDFDRLDRTMALADKAWRLQTNGRGQGYVRTKYNGSETTIARLVMEEPPARIAYRDGNRLNLRRGNLYLEDQVAGDHHRKLVKRAPGPDQGTTIKLPRE